MQRLHLPARLRSRGIMNISEIAKKTGLTAKAIRFYEEKGLITPPERGENSYRYYQERHLNNLCYSNKQKTLALHWMNVASC